MPRPMPREAPVIRATGFMDHENHFTPANARPPLRERRRSLISPGSLPLLAAADQRRFKIGRVRLVDREDGGPAALAVGKEIGLDGVQISLGTAANDMHLRQASVQEEYRGWRKETGVAVASLAIGDVEQHPVQERRAHDRLGERQH
jgi:hypothetical protein